MVNHKICALILKEYVFFLERELENYKAAFREHDEDGSGKLSIQKSFGFQYL